jgi:hypothetical protein
MLLFGAAQLVLSFIPNFHSMAWLSAVAAAMSFTYATIGLGLGLAKTVGDGAVRGSVAGVPVATAAQKTWLVAQAVGDIAFAYPYTIVLLEIQDTLRSSPPEGETMRKGNVVAVLATTFFYLCPRHLMAWLSAVAAAMSFTYATIGLGLGLAKTIARDPRTSLEASYLLLLAQIKEVVVCKSLLRCPLFQLTPCSRSSSALPARRASGCSSAYRLHLLLLSMLVSISLASPSPSPKS